MERPEWKYQSQLGVLAGISLCKKYWVSPTLYQTATLGPGKGVCGGGGGGGAWLYQSCSAHI